MGLGDTEDRGDASTEMGDYLDAVQFGDDFIPKKVRAGMHFNCALSNQSSIKCWGMLSALSLCTVFVVISIEHCMTSRCSAMMSISSAMGPMKTEETNPMKWETTSARWTWEPALFPLIWRWELSTFVL